MSNHPKKLYSAIVKSMKTKPTTVRWYDINYINGYCHMTWKDRELKVNIHVVNDDDNYSRVEAYITNRHDNLLISFDVICSLSPDNLTKPEWCAAFIEKRIHVEMDSFINNVVSLDKYFL
jgi:hypothetical protein